MGNVKMIKRFKDGREVFVKKDKMNQDYFA